MDHGCQKLDNLTVLAGLLDMDGCTQAVHQKSYLRLVRKDSFFLFEAPIFSVSFDFLVLVLNNALLHRHSSLLDPLREPRYARCSF